VVGLNPADQSIVIYVNQQEIRNANVPSGSISFPSPNTPFSIGKNTMGEMLGIYDIDYFSGALDEIKIYSGVATQDAVDFINSQYNPPATVNYEINIDYSGDNNRPTYHPIPDFGWANEANGLVLLNGTYHMFYQKNEVFLGIAQQNWGHFTSSDLVNWDEQNAVLWPTEDWDSVGCWAGDSQILQDGTPAVIYTGVDGIKAVIATATSSDGYQTLDKNPEPIIDGAPSDTNLDFRDPYVWESNGEYHMIIGGGVAGSGGNVLYYSSADFENWTYGGVAFSGSVSQGEGQFWEVPILYEFPNGKEMLLVQKTPDATPARTFYWIGEFENGVFTPDSSESKDLEIVNGFLSPTVAADANGLVTAIGIIPDEVEAEFQMQQGWANLFSIPQIWSLNANNDIVVQPHPNLINYRGEATSFPNIALTDGSSDHLNGYSGRHFEMEATINTGTAEEVGFIFGRSSNGQEEYRVYYNMTTQEWVVDASDSSLSTQVRRDIRTGDYAIAPGSTIDVQVFIDGSVLEVFVNNESHFTGRFFPTQSDADGVDVFATGGNATMDITIYEINN
jgi:sucrose-6-phosphate hydrolase SacC (GH32 family)